MKLPKNSRAVSACAISPCGEYVGTADKSNDHMVTIFKVSDGSKCFTDKGGPDPIVDLAFSKKEGEICMWSAGTKHFAQWNLEKGKVGKGIFGGKGDQTSMACVTADDQGTAYSGGANAMIYIWNGRNLKECIGVHEKGFVGALNWVDGKLYTGGRDGRVNIIDTAGGNAVL
jgi:microtubule-associated protein-like 6